jgi:D-sedoheptulose 7-phosphate isomerase
MKDKNYLKEQVASLQSTIDLSMDEEMLNKIEELAVQILQIFLSGGKIAFVGNGGSAAEAMHLAAEFTGKCLVDHPPLAAICLNESQSALTAIANDFGIEYMFERSVRALIKPNDLLIALSTSGKSKNIISAIESAQSIGARVILWSGEDCPDRQFEIWRARSVSTPRIQEVHLLWGHLVAEIVESHWS